MGLVGGQIGDGQADFVFVGEQVGRRRGRGR